MDSEIGHPISSDMTQPLLLIFASIVALILTGIGVGWMWGELGVHMTMHGWIAYGLGAFGSLAVASGLFYLTFKSAREGYDDFDRPEDLSDRGRED